jgi:TonB-linked SusC/RagA family outer membrane protein
MKRPFTPSSRRLGATGAATLLVLLLQAPHTPAAAQLLAAHRPETQVGPEAGAAPAPTRLPLKELLGRLETNFGVTILYESSLVTGKEVLVPTTGTLEEQLAAVLPQASLRYKRLRANYYVVKPGRSAEVRADVSVSGRVVDEKGEGLPGVTVLVKGTSLGTSTSPDGSFTLTAPEGSSLVFSAVGYAPQETTISAATEGLRIVMATDVKALSEVVVVGYGTQRREDVTGSIASVTEQEIKTQPITGLDQAVQGRAAGVQVSQNSGAPGGSVSIRVRGVGTVGNAEPLYVVDGVPFYNNTDVLNGAAGSNGNSLNTINPADIASIDILKDASATAIYGSRGANGVVIITTKRGKAGRTNINLDVYGGVQQVANKIELLNATQFAELNNETLINGGRQPNSRAIVGDKATSPDYSNPAALGQGTDWLNEIFRTAGIQSYNLNVNGGSEKTQFALSGGYFKQDGTVIGSDFKRYSTRLNLDHQVNNRIKVGNNLTLSRTEQNIVTTDEDTQSGLVFLAMNQLPTLPVFRGGTYAGPDGVLEYVGDLSNPVGRANAIDNNLYRNRLLGNIFGELEIAKDLRFRTSLGLDATFREYSFFEPSYKWGGIVRQTAALDQGTSEELVWLAENTLTYSKTLAEKHALTVLLGQSAQSSNSRFLGGRDNTYVFNSLQALNSGSGTYSANGGQNQWSLLSYMGRVNYAFADKYLFTGTVRVDGSSRFGPENKYGVFPSGSVAWRVSQESFLKDNPRVSDLKLRASYGITGNQNIGLYGFATQLGTTQRYVIGNSGVPGVTPSTLPNPGVQWEPNRQADLGIDLGLFNNRIQLTADVYQRTTTKMLITPNVVPSSGYISAAEINAGEVENKGVELGLNTRNLEGELTWGTNFNISFVRNEVLQLINDQPLVAGSILTQFTSRTAVGRPIGSFYGYVTDGVFQTEEQVRNHATQQPGTAPGDIRYRDLNGDGTINDDDRTFIGNQFQSSRRA